MSLEKENAIFSKKKIYLFKKPNSQSKYLLSFINSEQMAQTLGIPKLNNTMFLSKKYQRSKQLQSNVPNAMTKTLKLSCWDFKGKLQLQWSLWGIEDFFFSPSLSFFSPQLQLRRESLLLSEYFSTSIVEGNLLPFWTSLLCLFLPLCLSAHSCLINVF